MSIPEKCTVLVVGGGPGGSYAATVLAREGINVVLLEAEKFPRYHIGESMIASMRHFLRFIDLDSTFDQYGFTKKVGAAFKLNGSNREGYTDFLAAGGTDNYAWNVVRSEADDLMFKHARKCGVHAFDGVKVVDIQFEPCPIANISPDDGETQNPGRPISASWHSKAEGSSGTVSFDYLVDATGRAGIVSTKYLKNRRMNTGLKNVASWGYWSNTGVYGPGTPRANSPLFEALKDESGWVWLIPLHNGTTSVGVVMNQDTATAKKRAAGQSKTPEELYSSSIQLAPSIHKLLDEATLLSEIKHASDYSYSASCYSSPYLRIVGDAGCFIDPYFSSGVHLALTSGLSAATTIVASIRGHDEAAAAQWHSTKFGDAYTRFLLIVLSAYKQIRRQEDPILSDFDEDNFDRAFGVFRAVIQGSLDTNSKLSQTELSNIVDFCSNAFEPTLPEERSAAMKKVNGSLMDGAIHQKNGKGNKMLDDKFAAEEIRVLNHIRARKMLRAEDTMGIASFHTDVIDGYAATLERGTLGLTKVN